MPTNLYSAVNAFDKTQAKKVKEYFGILGLPVSQKTVNVPNRNGYVYVRLRDNESEIIQAYNEEVSPVWGLPVIIIRQGNGWRIKGRDVERYNDWGSDSSFLPAHHYQHEFNPSVPGGDVVFVYPQAFVPLLVTPSGTDGGPNVIMQSINFKKDNGDWLQAGVTGTSSLLVYKPTDGTAIVGLAYLNRDTGNPGFLINSGSAPAASVTGVHDLLQYLPDLPSDDYEPLAMVRLVSGTESVGWSNIYDIRQFLRGIATGTSGGGIEEAPIDGLVYGRKDADWVEVSGTSGGLPTLDANRVVITDGDGTITSDPHFEYDYVNDLLVIGSDYTKVPFAAKNAAFVVGSGSSPSMGMIGYGEDIAPFYTFVRARGDWDTPLAVQDGDVIGRNRFRGHDGTTFPATRAEIRAQALGTWGTGSHGTEVVTSITPSGTTTMVDMLTVNQAGADLLYGTYNISGSPHTHTIPDPRLTPVYAPLEIIKDFSGESSAPTGWAWAGAPFSTPSDIFNLNSRALAFRGLSSSERTFLYKSYDASMIATDANGVFYSLMSIFAVGGASGDSFYAGVRLDDNSDNNYVEFGILYSITGIPFRFYSYFRTGGGGVTSREESGWANPLPAPNSWFRLSVHGTTWSNWSARGNFLSDYRLLSTDIVASLTWTPVRVGITGRYQTSASNAIYLMATGF